MNVALARISSLPFANRVLLAVIKERNDKAITELITRLALGGPFHLISCGHWLPDQDSLRRTVRRYTVAVDKTLDHLLLGRPATCLQLLDQLERAGLQPYPILVLNFLHHFFDPDVDLSLRLRVLDQCCQEVKHLSSSKPVVILIHELPTEEYRQLFPLLNSIADEVIESVPESAARTSQPMLF